VIHVLAQAATTHPVENIGGLALLGVVVALANGLMDVVKSLAKSASNRRNGNGTNAGSVICRAGCDETHMSRVDGIYAVVTKTDNQGVPLVYGSQRLNDAVHELIGEIRTLRTSQDRLIEVLVGMAGNRRSKGGE
jgi:hypothetical protein